MAHDDEQSPAHTGALTLLQHLTSPANTPSTTDTPTQENNHVHNTTRASTQACLLAEMLQQVPALHASITGALQQQGGLRKERGVSEQAQGVLDAVRGVLPQGAPAAKDGPATAGGRVWSPLRETRGGGTGDGTGGGHASLYVAGVVWGGGLGG